MTEPEPTPIDDDDVTFSQLGGEHLGRLVRLDGHDGRQLVGRLICVSLSTSRSRWTPEPHEIRVEITLEWDRDQVVTVQKDGNWPVTFVEPPVVDPEDTQFRLGRGSWLTDGPDPHRSS